MGIRAFKITIMTSLVLLTIAFFPISMAQSTDIPTITSISLNQNEFTSGGTSIVTIIVNSVSPACWVDYRLDGPNGNILGGGSGVTFTNIGTNTWQYQLTYQVSANAPPGDYTWSNIGVGNEAQQWSAKAAPLTFRVNGATVDDTPVITSISLNQEQFTSGGTSIVTIVVSSISPACWVDYRLDGPNGNILGGGSGVTFTNIGTNTWQYQLTYQVSPYAPAGTYTWSNIRVGNEAQQWSATAEPLTFIVGEAPSITPTITPTPSATPTILPNATVTPAPAITATPTPNEMVTPTPVNNTTTPTPLNSGGDSATSTVLPISIPVNNSTIASIQNNTTIQDYVNRTDGLNANRAIPSPTSPLYLIIALIIAGICCMGLTRIKKY